MRKDLDQALCAKYPEIFRDRYQPLTDTAMCWGFSCGDGWYTLIDTCCRLIMGHVRQLRQDIAYCQDMVTRQDQLDGWAKEHYTPARLEQLHFLLEDALQDIPVATQVKEKYGGLRFYVERATPEQRAYIRFAESMSYRTCETCGTTHEVYQTKGWVRTVCLPCATAEHLVDRLDRDSDA